MVLVAATVIVGSTFTSTICEVEEEQPVMVLVPVTWYKIGAVGETTAVVTVPSVEGLVQE